MGRAIRLMMALMMASMMSSALAQSPPHPAEGLAFDRV